MKRIVLAAACAAVMLGTGPTAAEVVVLEASQDATLIEHPDGALANGSGPAFFAGRNNQAENSVRRGAILFDIAGALPDQALIESVELELTVLPGNAAPRTLRLHRLLDPWGEGPASSAGGGGAPSQVGDVTWLHTFYDDAWWVEPGGQFPGRASAEAIVVDQGLHVWGSTQHMVQDVKLWSEAPGMNHGWIIIGDETLPQTAKSIASREHPDASLRPRLRIVYRLPGEDPAAP